MKKERKSLTFEEIKNSGEWWKQSRFYEETWLSQVPFDENEVDHILTTLQEVFPAKWFRKSFSGPLHFLHETVLFGTRNTDLLVLRDLSDATKEWGIKEMKNKLRQPNSDGRAGLFEIEVALLYHRDGWDTHFLPETHIQSPDLKATKTGLELYIECKSSEPNKSQQFWDMVTVPLIHQGNQCCITLSHDLEDLTRNRKIDNVAIAEKIVAITQRAITECVATGNPVNIPGVVDVQPKGEYALSYGRESHSQQTNKIMQDYVTKASKQLAEVGARHSLIFIDFNDTLPEDLLQLNLDVYQETGEAEAVSGVVIYYTQYLGTYNHPSLLKGAKAKSEQELLSLVPDFLQQQLNYQS